MAAAGTQQAGNCTLVKVGELVTKARRDPLYTGLVCLPENQLMLVNSQTNSIRLHERSTGQLIAESDRSLSYPRDICLLDESGSQVAVTLEDGEIRILSVQCTEQTAAINTVRTIKTKLEECYGVRAITSSSKLVVSGRSMDMLCWYVMSITSNEEGNIHNICPEEELDHSYLTISNDQLNVYISCLAGWNSIHNAVYGYNLESGSRIFIYKLTRPRGICVDKMGFIYICNEFPDFAIHQLNKDGILVLVFEKGIPNGPRAACFDENQVLYITSWRRKKISRFQIEWHDKGESAIPEEILRMDEVSLRLYKEALHNGSEKVYNIRVMVVGQYGVGKTTLIKRLLGEDVQISEKKSTEGIDVHVHCCRVSLETKEWMVQHNDANENLRFQRFLKLLTKSEVRDESEGDTDESRSESDVIIYHNDLDIDEDELTQLQADLGQEVNYASAHPTELSSAAMDQNSVIKDARPVSSSVAILESEMIKRDTMVDFLQLVNKHADKLEKGRVEYAPLGMWDFAGQYVFYATHQIFLTRRAVYLLVTDLSQHVTDIIQDDEFFFDRKGIKECNVHDLVDVWLNSIHCCAPSSESGTPPVILVGTHLDQIYSKSGQDVAAEYFSQLRIMLKNKPTRLHLADDDFAIDNTKRDSVVLEGLKRKIVELASRQSYWGEVVPSRWLPMEHAIMKLKSSGTKVVSLSLVQKINRASSVQIESEEELDLFLRFHHDVGTILYFSTKQLRDKIVLEPQWLIDALKSLITSKMFILTKHVAISETWCEFNENGKLTPALIDVVWTKEKNPEFHDNKDHILLLMEKLNIIARPMSYGENGDKVITKDYFLAPCMLRQETPKEVISPEPNPDMESTSVLCFVFTENFLPSPIFHKLIAACVTQWPISIKKSKNLIFCGCCVFDLDRYNKLTLHFKDYIIFARVTRMGITEKTPSLRLCIEAKDFITETLSKIIEYLGKSLKFELFIRCKEYDGERVDGLIPVSQLQQNQGLPCHSHDKDHMIASYDLLKFWFDDKDNDDGEPITQEHINHARLCNALTTVCSDALREALKCQVPAPHADIYQAIKFNKVILTNKTQNNKGQWQSALLNKDQCQLVFPDPKGLNTGKLDEFDISLLYILIRNVSSVPSPSTGWGKPPLDQPRDTSLGSSVERIRLCRNKVSGHSEDGKISQQDFEDYWSKIGDILHDIENVIGDKGYRTALETRRNQAITSREAREQRRKFQAYKEQLNETLSSAEVKLKTALAEIDKARNLKN